jgi:hypothetical protein
MAAVELGLDLVEIEFAMVQQHQSGGTSGGGLTAQLSADRTTRPVPRTVRPASIARTGSGSSLRDGRGSRSSSRRSRKRRLPRLASTLRTRYT